MSCPRGCCATYREHLLSIGISAAAMPSRKGPLIAVDKKQEEWDRDMPAYHELRKQGLQPPQIDGSDELSAKAETNFEIERGKPIHRKVRNAMEHVMESDIT